MRLNECNERKKNMDTVLKKKALTYVHPTSMSNNTEKINQIIQKIIQTIKPINQKIYLSSLSKTISAKSE